MLSEQDKADLKIALGYIDKYQRVVEDIRKKCAHETMRNERSGSFMDNSSCYQKICSICGEYLGYTIRM